MKEIIIRELSEVLSSKVRPNEQDNDFLNGYNKSLLDALHYLNQIPTKTCSANRLFWKFEVRSFYEESATFNRGYAEGTKKIRGIVARNYYSRQLK